VSTEPEAPAAPGVTPAAITEAELEQALVALAAITRNGNNYYPELARNIFGYVAHHRAPGPLVMPPDELEAASLVAAIPSPSPASPERSAVIVATPEGGWRERAEAAEAKVLEYENAITWNTTCLSCSAVLDSAIAETFRREQAEAKLAATAAYCRQHKGEAGFSWVRALDILAITGSEEEARDG